MDSESKCGLPKLVKCMPMKKKIDAFIAILLSVLLFLSCSSSPALDSIERIEGLYFRILPEGTTKFQTEVRVAELKEQVTQLSEWPFYGQGDELMDQLLDLHAKIFYDIESDSLSIEVSPVDTRDIENLLIKNGIEQMRKGLYQVVTGVFDEIKRMMIQAFFHKKETELTIGKDGVKVAAWDSISNTIYTFRRNGKEVEWMGNKGGLEVSGLMHASYFGDELVFSNYQFSVQQTESEITISYHKPGDLLLPKEVAIQTKMGLSAIHLTLIFSNWFFS